MTGQSWTPAPKPGLIPLHPMTFSTLLGKSFAALRHNPKVLFGFAVVVQLGVLLISAGILAVVMINAFVRLETVRPGSSAFESIFAGSMGIAIVAGFAVSLGSIAFTALVQGVVAADVGEAAIGVKPTLRQLWRRVKPVFWRLLGFALLSMLAITIVMLVFGLVAAGGVLAMGGFTAESVGIAFLVMFLGVILMLPLIIWLNTKLLLVPSTLVLEHATLRQALVRSWRLTRGRFWFTFGIAALITIIMGFATQIVTVPTSMLGSLFGAIVAPTGPTDASSTIAFVLAMLLPQVLSLVVQAITTVVQTTGAALVYIDSRMRYEGLDQTLLAHVERRHSGAPAELLSWPFDLDPARAVGSTVPTVVATPPSAFGAAAPYGAPYGYPAPAQGYAQPAPGYAAPPAGYAAPPPGYYAAPPAGYAAPPPAYTAPVAPATPSEPPRPTPPTDSPWAAPGADQG